MKTSSYNFRQFKTKSELVYSILKEKIINGELEIGCTLKISELADQFDNVSETPIREAIKSLKSDGLLEVIPYSGMRVTVPSLNELNEILNVRLILEIYASELFAENTTEEYLNILENILSEMEKCTKEDNKEKYSKLDKEFHFTIYEHCGNKTVYELIYNLWSKSERTRSIFEISQERMKKSLKDHKYILDLIKNKEVKDVKIHIKKHKEKSFSILLSYIEEYYKKNNLK